MNVRPRDSKPNDAKNDVKAETEEKEKPLTPEQEVEKGVRAQERKVAQRFYFENLRRRGIFRYTRSDGTPVEEELPNTPGAPRATLQTGSGSIPILKKMEEGWYNLYEVAEPGKEVEYDKFMVTIYVDKNGGITPAEYPNATPHRPWGLSYEKNPYEFTRIWTQVIRAYKAGLGVNHLNYDYPNCYDKEGKPDPAQYMLIDLDDVLRMARIARREEVALHIPPGSALEARLANPGNNKKAHELAKLIRQEIAESQNAVASNKVLNEQQAKMVHAFHADELKTDSDALKTKAKELKEAADADVPAKIKELDTAREKLDKRLSSINTEFDKYKPSTDLCAKYDRAFSNASKIISEASALIDEKKVVPEKDTAEFAKLKKGLNDLKTKTDELSKKAGIEGLPSKDRVESKKGNLTSKMSAMTSNVNTLTTTTDVPTREAAAKSVIKDFDELAKQIENIRTEVNKENSPEELQKYRDTIREAQVTFLEADEKIRSGTLDNDDLNKQLNETRTRLGIEFDDTLKKIDRKMNPATFAEDEKNRLAQELTKIKDVLASNDALPSDKLGEFSIAAKSIQKRVDTIDQRRADLAKQLEACKAMSEADAKKPLETITKELKDLEVESKYLHERERTIEELFARTDNEKFRSSSVTDVSGKEQKEINNVSKSFRESNIKLQKYSDNLTDLTKQAESMQVTVKAGPGGP